ncbi:MAG: replication-associated recombination protein A, partial [Actinobacteria bacterium]|nr:replication-associated recombination protein A [Actinomycetota bacterium]
AVEDLRAAGVPEHLRDSGYFRLEKLAGSGKKNHYKYPHAYPGGYVRQQYLPDNLLGTEFYTPSESGEEKDINNMLERLKNFKF